MTTKQSWAIFCKTGYDVRKCDLNQSDINSILNDKISPKDFPGVVIRREIKAKRNDYGVIWEEAVKAGKAAMNKCTPEPMVVQEHQNMLDDKSKVVKSYFVPGGVCGFAWIIIRPGTCSFARWTRKMRYTTRNSYSGGEMYWIGEGGQSMQLKRTFAHAMALSLAGHGIKASSYSRID